MATKKTETVTHLSWKSPDIGWHSLIIATVGWGVGYKKLNTVNLALVNSLQCLTLLVGRQEGHPACKQLDVVLLMVCDRSFASLIAPIVTTAFIILSFNNIQNGYVLVSANPGLPGKWPLKRTERERYASVLEMSCNWQYLVIVCWGGVHKGINTVKLHGASENKTHNRNQV